MAYYYNSGNQHISIDVETILREWHPAIRKKVDPKEIFQYIRGLTDFDKQVIERTLDREGPQIAADKMIEAIRRRDQRSGFLCFLAALLEHGHQELATKIMQGTGIINSQPIQHVLHEERSRMQNLPPQPVVAQILPEVQHVNVTAFSPGIASSQGSPHYLNPAQYPQHGMPLQPGYNPQNNAHPYLIGQAHANPNFSFQRAQDNPQGHQQMGPPWIPPHDYSFIGPAGYHQPVHGYPGTNTTPLSGQVHVQSMSTGSTDNQSSRIGVAAISPMPQSSLDPGDTIDDIPFNVIGKIVTELNKATEPGWKKLAQDFKVPWGKVKEIEKTTNPAESLLEHLSSKNQMTVSQLMSCFERLGLQEALRCIQSELPNDSSALPQPTSNVPQQNLMQSMPNIQQQSVTNIYPANNSSYNSNGNITEIQNVPGSGLQANQSVMSHSSSPSSSVESQSSRCPDSISENRTDIAGESSSTDPRAEDALTSADAQNNSSVPSAGGEQNIQQLNIPASTTEQAEGGYVDNDTFNNLNKVSKEMPSKNIQKDEKEKVYQEKENELENTQMVAENGIGLEDKVSSGKDGDSSYLEPDGLSNSCNETKQLNNDTYSTDNVPVNQENLLQNQIHSDQNFYDDGSGKHNNVRGNESEGDVDNHPMSDNQPHGVLHNPEDDTVQESSMLDDQSDGSLHVPDNTSQQNDAAEERKIENKSVPPLAEMSIDRNKKDKKVIGARNDQQPVQCTSVGENTDNPNLPCLQKYIEKEETECLIEERVVTQNMDLDSGNRSASLSSAPVIQRQKMSSKGKIQSPETDPSNKEFDMGNIVEDAKQPCNRSGKLSSAHVNQGQTGGNRGPIQSPVTDPDNKEFDRGNITEGAEEQPSLRSFRDIQNSIPGSARQEIRAGLDSENMQGNSANSLRGMGLEERRMTEISRDSVASALSNVPEDSETSFSSSSIETVPKQV